MINNGNGEAAKQANSTKRTTEERGNKGDPSEFARKNTSVRKRKHGARSTERATSIYSLQESGREKTKKLMFGRSPVLLEGDVRDRRFAGNVIRVLVQLGRNSGEWENTR